jgi:hypothetical protein
VISRSKLGIRLRKVISWGESSSLLALSYYEARLRGRADGCGNRMFHFGGSSHTILFEKGVKVSGFPGESDENVPVRSKLCVVE